MGSLAKDAEKSSVGSMKDVDGSPTADDGVEATDCVSKLISDKASSISSASPSRTSSRTHQPLPAEIWIKYGSAVLGNIATEGDFGQFSI